MKKIAVILICTLLSAKVQAQTQTQAQTQSQLCRHELSVTYGAVTFPEVIYYTGYVLGTIFTLGQWTMDNIDMYGAVGAEYNYFFNKTLAVGGTFVWDSMHGSHTNDDGTLSEYFLDAYTLMANCKAKWFDKKHFSMYSRLSLGASYYTLVGDNSWVPAFQLSPISCEFGGENLRGLIETGFGNQGLILAGLRYRF